MKKVVICSGAGLSVASGVPTFRCQGGLWEQYALEDVCYLPNFLKIYIQTNEFYEARRKQLKTVKPNPAHLSLARMQERFKDKLDIIHFTTNVDDLLEQAGCTNVLHIHGNLKELIINWKTDKETVVPADGVSWTDPNLYPVKPNVVFFGEIAPAYNTVYNTFSSLQEDDCVIVVGSSEEVFNFSRTVKLMYSAKVIYIGPELPKHASPDIYLDKKAEEFDFELLAEFLLNNEL